VRVGAQRRGKPGRGIRRARAGVRSGGAGQQRGDVPLARCARRPAPLPRLPRRGEAAAPCAGERNDAAVAHRRRRRVLDHRGRLRGRPRARAGGAAPAGAGMDRMSGRPRQRGERAADLALAGAIAAACCALASDVVPWPWLAGHAAPAIVLLLARRALRRPWAVVLVALLALFAASTALRATVPASEATPVASILSAPLAFFALRRA